MARLTKEVVLERENFVRELFRADPKKTGVAVQSELKTKYGRVMRPNRIYELRYEVWKELAMPTDTTSDVESTPQNTETTPTTTPEQTVTLPPEFKVEYPVVVTTTADTTLDTQTSVG